MEGEERDGASPFSLTEFPQKNKATVIAKEKPTDHIVHVGYTEPREPQNRRAWAPTTNGTGPAWGPVGSAAGEGH